MHGAVAESSNSASSYLRCAMLELQLAAATARIAELHARIAEF